MFWISDRIAALIQCLPIRPCRVDVVHERYVEHVLLRDAGVGAHLGAFSLRIRKELG